jgi:hypothetical protein
VGAVDSGHQSPFGIGATSQIDCHVCVIEPKQALFRRSKSHRAIGRRSTQLWACSQQPLRLSRCLPKSRTAPGNIPNTLPQTSLAAEDTAFWAESQVACKWLVAKPSATETVESETCSLNISCQLSADSGKESVRQTVRVQDLIFAPADLAFGGRNLGAEQRCCIDVLMSRLSGSVRGMGPCISMGNHRSSGRMSCCPTR